MKYLKKTDHGVQVVYTNMDAGCMTVLPGIMVAVSLLIFYFLPELGIIKGLIGLIIGIMAFLLFGGILLRILMIIRRKNPVLIEVRDGYLMDRKKKVPISEINEVSFGWNQGRLGGIIFPDLAVQTIHNKRYYFCYYNLISERAIKELVEQYILPFATPQCKSKWEKHFWRKNKAQ
ncbi:DUF5381 family protein [Aneurinibacillus thermoaerophilus]|uniref:YfjD family protein n=1 Tax=Aneurinibacillus thermoaerophilus TaxID=143495 RepID=A0ABX8YAF3_ANETH|nr:MULTISPECIES: DUF5381 family protein [Aneurinibacillus]AMA71862.1 hypothetical protein ACH33_02745 [Aneurinibacillus sp. XH2]MED0677231.1 DUF5381 family protein [Aneurinibacillus thermoaerophilus]MED0757906.1 DUF5381 family protein [Aneurinibacillus thermoaerophilus]MED0761604.1 DUF5381 family protein [Aneurinibacillus thermoaerophilus]QYY42371.1 YfjD family protein [Aneurinibacillus thermoaerophilus]